MLEFVKNAFRKFLGAVLWLNFIACVIFGIVSGVGWGKILGPAGPFLGFLVGLIVGVFIGAVTNIVFGGLIATLLNIDKNLELLREKFAGGSVEKPVTEKDDINAV